MSGSRRSIKKRSVTAAPVGACNLNTHIHIYIYMSTVRMSGTRASPNVITAADGGSSSNTKVGARPQLPHIPFRLREADAGEVFRAETSVQGLRCTIHGSVGSGKVVNLARMLFRTGVSLAAHAGEAIMLGVPLSPLCGTPTNVYM